MTLQVCCGRLGVSQHAGRGSGSVYPDIRGEWFGEDGGVQEDPAVHRGQQHSLARRGAGQGQAARV